jgi:outer membrane protein assembly factor BamD
MRFRLYIVLIIVMLVSSCGEYEKLLKSTDYDLKKVKAIEYYNATQYIKATELFAQILPRYRATEEAEELNFMNAKAYYGMKDYIMAGSYFNSYVEQYPFGKNSEEANFLAAMCDYRLAPRASLDQESTSKALEVFNIFIVRFPSSPKVEESKVYIKELEEKLVEKSYISAKLYYDMRQYKAAVVALTNSLKEYADTKYREEMMYLKLSSLFLYAEYSLAIRQKERYQATLDDYYSFMEEYPESKYDREVKKIYDETASFLKVGTSGIGVPETAVINQ